MKLHLKILLSIFFTLVFVGLSGGLGSARLQASRAQQIWEQAIAAKGGREHLHAVRNIVISSRGQYRHGLKIYQVHTEAFFVFPNKIWTWNDYRPDVFGLTVEMYNFDTGVRYFSNSDNPPPQSHVIPSYETNLSNTYGLLGYLLETKWLKPKILGTSAERIEGRTIDVVHTMLQDNVSGFLPEDRYIDFAFARTTHLPVRVSYYHVRGGERVLDLTEYLSDYTEVNGIKFPQQRKVEGSIDRIKIQINVEYNEDIFNKPPLVQAGAEAWKVR